MLEILFQTLIARGIIPRYCKRRKCTRGEVRNALPVNLNRVWGFTEEMTDVMKQRGDNHIRSPVLELSKARRLQRVSELAHLFIHVFPFAFKVGEELLHVWVHLTLKLPSIHPMHMPPTANNSRRPSPEHSLNDGHNGGDRTRLVEGGCARRMHMEGEGGENRFLRNRKKKKKKVVILKEVRDSQRPRFNVILFLFPVV